LIVFFTLGFVVKVNELKNGGIKDTKENSYTNLFKRGFE